MVYLWFSVKLCGQTGLGGPTVAVNTVYRANEAMNTQEFQEQAVRVKSLVDATKTQQRSPKKMKEFMKMTGMDEEAFLDADIAAGMLKSNVVEAETFFSVGRAQSCRRPTTG